MNKQIITIASILFAVMFIGVLALIVMSVNNKTVDTETEINSLIKTENAYDLEDYVGKTIKGTELINIIEYNKNRKETSTAGTYITITVSGVSSGTKDMLWTGSSILVDSSYIDDKGKYSITANTGSSSTHRKYKATYLG